MTSPSLVINRFSRCFSASLVVALFLFISGARLAYSNPSSPRETPVVKAVRMASPAVVNISSTHDTARYPHPFSGMGMNDFFDSFFKDFLDPDMERRLRRSSLGSGVIIDGEKGLIITNAHVIANTGTIKVALLDEREFEAQIVGADPDYDLAVLKITSDKGLPSIEMGNSDDLMIGETVIAIGNPFGFSHTVTTGVVSALNRSIRTEKRVYHQFIQTDASINPGNSGGPLLNITGELVGINTAIYTNAQGIGFAIPISKAKKIISDLIQHGEVIQSWIGVMVQGLDARQSRRLGLTEPSGLLVVSVDRGSPAHAASIIKGDVLLSLNGRPLLSVEDYHATLRGVAAETPVEAVFWRNGLSKRVSVITKPFPLELADALSYSLLGIRAVAVSDPHSPKGVVITSVDPGSFLARIGARKGDIIRYIDDKAIDSLDDYRQAVIKSRHKKSLVILLQREGRGYYVAVEL